jgi:hypothetical protein
MAVDIEALIANAENRADAQLSAASSAIRDAITASQGYASPIYNPLEYHIAAVEPSVPDVENASLTYEAQRDQLIALLTDELANFYTTYYPLAADAFDEAVNWMVNVITVGGTGLAPGVEEQLWQRGRDRIVADGLRAEAQIMDEFSARGFSLPSGAMTARIDAARFESMKAVGDLSRDVTIRQAEIEIENLRFAVDQAVRARMGAMAAASDYIRALMSGPDIAARVASINSDAKARMMSATADLYRARLARDELAMKVPYTNTTEGVKVTGLFMDGFYKGIQNRVTAAVAGAESYGRSAQAALASLNSVASSSQVGFG